MKRSFCWLLLFSILLSGCSMPGERMKEPVTFYYVSETYQEDMSQVILTEVREASGHRDELSYLLALYSMGPSKENLKSPLPRNTGIMLTEYVDDKIAIKLSDSAMTMEDSDFTLACACISLTCMGLTDAAQVTVVCGERTITIQKDQLLYSSMLPDTQEETP